MEKHNAYEDKLVEDSPVVKLVNLILQKSCSEDITEVYLEPAEYYLNIRARKNGEIVQIFDPLPRKIISSLVNRIKIISGLDITVRNRIQSGKVKVSINGKKQEFAIKTIPLKYGEKVIIFPLNRSLKNLGLKDLIIDNKTLDIVHDILNNSSGLLVVSGPKNSGRTLTSYAILAHKNKKGERVATVEDQIKYSLPDINQVEISENKEIDYETVIQSFILEDIGVIFVKDIPDIKTTKTLVEASITGHFVLTNVPSHDAVGTIASLNELGLSLPTLANSLIGIINQRLVRRLCTECRIPYKPSYEVAQFFPQQQQNNLTLYKPRVDGSSDQICDKCKGTGYHGIVSIYEVLQISKQIRALMANNADYMTIKNMAVKEGMISLFSYGLDLVLNGQTSMEELEQMFPQEFEQLRQEAVNHLQSTSQISQNNHVLESLARLESQVEMLTIEIQKISRLLEENKTTEKTGEALSKEEKTSQQQNKDYDLISDPW